MVVAIARILVGPVVCAIGLNGAVMVPESFVGASFRLTSMIDALNARFWHIIAFVLAAVAAAAFLRHTVHVYGGISREEIRVGALAACSVVFLMSVLITAKRRS